MAPIAPSPDSKAADLIQNLSLNSESQTNEAPGSANRSANGTSTPYYPNSSFVPNEYSSGYYYGGYNGQGNDWNGYSRYLNFDGAMPQGAYGDNSYMYHQGYGYTSYGAYTPPPVSSTMQHDGQPYGMQQYQYPYYYRPPVSADGPLATNKSSVRQREISSNHVPSSGPMNKGNTVSMGIGNPLSGNQGARFSNDRTQSAIPSDALLFSDRQFNHGARVGFSSPVVVGKDFSSQRNQNLSQPFPHLMGLMNRMHPSMYSQYGNAFRSNSRYGSAGHGSRSHNLKASSNVNRASRGVDNVKRNMDGIDELNKGPRSKSSDNGSDKSVTPVTSLLEGPNPPKTSDDKEVPVVPNKDQYNGQDLSDGYSDAKFFVIKSYSEDDVHKSIKYSVWASTPNGNKKLNAAYEEAKERPDGCPVFLLFSVNTSGQFVGLAEMVGPVDFEKTAEYWQQDRWTGCFPVKWHIIKDIPNVVLRHITIENNENKPVTNSRDTQEVKFEKGIQILNILKGHTSKACILDDFEFYEAREKVMRERKSKEPHFPKHVSKLHDNITNEAMKQPESLDGTSVNGSAPAADAVAVQVNVEATAIGENGSTTQPEDSSRTSRPVIALDQEGAPNGVSSIC